jgi:4-hydroxy-2-oxoheptanedioate aldolase
MRPNQIKTLLREDKAALGPIFGIPSPALVEMVGYMGFDFVLLDGEHGSLTQPLCEDLVRAADTVGLTTVVRVPRNESSTIAGYLETGAAGVMVPDVRTAEQAQAAVDAARYAPEGRRGLGPSRAAAYGLSQNLGEYAQEANAQNLLIIQIEDISAVPNLDAILAVRGIDVALIGPGDLSKSMGLAGKSDDPRVLQVIEQIARKILASGVTLGMITGDGAGARREIARGARFVIVYLPRLFVAAGREFVKQAKDAGPRTPLGG